MEAGQSVCPQCGRPMVATVPAVPGLQFELISYASKIKSLSVVWFIYAGVSALLGFLGLAFANAVLSGRFHYWMHGPVPPYWMMGPGLLHFARFFILLRVGLAVAAGWGLLERAAWGRIVAIVAAFLCVLKFPFGTALAIRTLVMLLGYRNTALYDQLQEG
jgi:hypothetical protein